MVIETPAVVLDMKKIKHNIERCQQMADSCGLKLRPHTKTHKMPELAKLQLAQGAVGITCASLSEAECMADNGIEDIFVAYPIIGRTKLERLLVLSERIRLITAVDSREGAVALSEAAAKRGVHVEVRLEIDTGMHRAGVHWENALELAQFISALPHIRMTGIFTYKSSVLNEKQTDNNPSAAKEEGELMAIVAEKLRASGVNITDVSGGSTPTAFYYGKDCGLTEIRPGSYIFGDVKHITSGVMKPEECAATVAVTVVSTPEANRAVIDGGVKAFSGDVPQNLPPLNIKGCGRLAVNHEGLVFDRMSEEHGVILSRDGGPTGLRIGQQIYVIPNHCCTVVNLVDNVYILNEDGSTRRERVAARGMSW